MSQGYLNNQKVKFSPKNFNLLNKNTKQLNLTNYQQTYKYRNVEKIPTKTQIHSTYRTLLRLALDTEYKIKMYSFNIYKNSPSFLEQFYHSTWETRYKYSLDLTIAEGLPEIYDDLNFEQANLTWLIMSHVFFSYSKFLKDEGLPCNRAFSQQVYTNGLNYYNHSLFLSSNFEILNADYKNFEKLMRPKDSSSDTEVNSTTSANQEIQKSSSQPMKLKISPKTTRLWKISK